MQALHLYRTIAQQAEAYVNEKSSKFYAFSYPVTSEEEVAAHLKQLRHVYPDANHHCSAYVLGAQGLQHRASDDGEPSGSAGKPILHAIQSLGLTDTMVVVVRYFGGKQLGVRGLIDVYNLAALQVLDASTIVERELGQQIQFHYRYEQEPFVQRLWKKFSLKPESHQPDMTGILVQVKVPLAQVDHVVSEIKSISDEVEIGPIR